MNAQFEEFPEFIEEALFYWDELAFFAYENYEEKGRIIIGIEPSDDPLELPQILAIKYDYENNKPHKDVAEIIQTYDPENELIIQFSDSSGKVQTIRLSTPENMRHPKRVYFFEMLRRINDTPDDVDFNTMPKWLLATLDNFND